VAAAAGGAAAITTYGPLWATTDFGGGGSEVLQVGVDVGDPTAIVVAPDHSIIVAVGTAALPSRCTQTGRSPSRAETSSGRSNPTDGS
jgi:hypothetical protein